MEKGKNYYELLGVDVKASEDEIRKAYREQLSLYTSCNKGRTHGEFSDMIWMLNQAINVLLVKEKRREYDKKIGLGPVRRPVVTLPVKPVSRSLDLFSYLKENNIEFYDMRCKNGALWVVGGWELGKALRRFPGFRFYYKAGGGRKTHYRDAWWSA